MNEEAKKTVLELIDRAAKERDATDALKWTQAALNAANALAVLSTPPR